MDRASFVCRYLKSVKLSKSDRTSTLCPEKSFEYPSRIAPLPLFYNSLYVSADVEYYSDGFRSGTDFFNGKRVADRRKKWVFLLVKTLSIVIVKTHSKNYSGIEF